MKIFKWLKWIKDSETVDPLIYASFIMSLLAMSLSAAILLKMILRYFGK